MYKSKGLETDSSERLSCYHWDFATYSFFPSPYSQPFSKLRFTEKNFGRTSFGGEGMDNTASVQPVKWLKALEVIVIFLISDPV